MRPADALAFPRMTFQRRTGTRKSRVQFQWPFFRHFQTTLFRHGHTVPVCSRGPISPVQTSTAWHVRHVTGDSDIKNPRKCRSASLWSRPAPSAVPIPWNLADTAHRGVAKRERPTVAYSRPPPIQFFAVGQTRLQSYLAKSATLCYNGQCFKCYTFCRLKLNWKYSISPAASLSYFAEYEGDSFCNFSCSSRHCAGYFHDASSKGSFRPLLCK